MPSITLKITTPARVFREIVADRVIIPALEGDMAVLPDCAPAVVLLRKGWVRKLSAENKEMEEWWVSGGVADISGNLCTVATPVAGDREPE